MLTRESKELYKNSETLFSYISDFFTMVLNKNTSLSLFDTSILFKNINIETRENIKIIRLSKDFRKKEKIISEIMDITQ